MRKSEGKSMVAAIFRGILPGTVTRHPGFSATYPAGSYSVLRRTTESIVVERINGDTERYKDSYMDHHTM